MKSLWSDAGEAVFFDTPFSALMSVAAVRGDPLSLSANQHPALAHALREAGVHFSLGEVGPDGLLLPQNGEAEVLISDYAGILPPFSSPLVFWNGGAGYLDEDAPAGEVTLIDLQSIHPLSEAPGAVVRSGDPKLLEEIERFAALGISKGHLWNDRIGGRGIDALMSPLVHRYWRERWEDFVEGAQRSEEIARLYAERFGALGSIDLLPFRFPRFFPLKLAPELFCPKESIYTALQERGIDVGVPFKPLYRYDAFAAEKLSGCENFYKAVLSLPTHGISTEEAGTIADTFVSVIGENAYRSCTF